MIATGFLLGLLGSFHCVGMCGPIAFMLPVDRTNSYKKVAQILLYHTGRLLSYATIGFIFGLLGKSLYIFGMQQRLSIIIGIVMIVAISIPYKTFSKYNFSKPIYRIISKVKSSLGKQFKKKSLDTFFTIGFLNGLLPCGLVYMAVFGAIALGSMWQGSLYMLFFGLGTIPLMTTAIYVGKFLNTSIKQRIQKAIPVFVVIIGVLFILRGLGLGIPYISPAPNAGMVTNVMNCH
ncbi:sulfite exporter TauE/SafE family protein [Kordia sp. YSTF-M3]|uniref:Sulfite exporter TauE/SafE family protein n=1 Tax=Kordia aestuariivivens TaxID=2759037 RepID=A0ABR7QFW3_9FLAO|nr:sulfite exporter TauE/SafE family protein [Kordia aestuariivivens]MBC8757266.1 sulfite exporter TauE/SafE family protein [Kordia aestuariivivens]